MHIHIEFTLTADDYAEYNLAYLKHRRSFTPRNRRGLRSPFVLSIIIACGIFAVYEIVSILTMRTPATFPATAPVSVSTPGEFLWSLMPFLLIYLAILALFIFLRKSKFLYRRLAATAIRANQIKSVDITEQSILIREPGCTTDVQWSYFIRFIETPNTFLLFVVARSAHVIPKRAFTSPQDLEAFRNFAAANIGSQPIGFPVEPAAPHESSPHSK